MRLILQIIFVAALAAMLAAGFHYGWWERAAARPPAGERLWQQGLWPLQDGIAAEISARAQAAATARTKPRPLRVAVRVDTSATSAWRFAPLRAADLAWRLNRADRAGPPVEIFTPVPGRPADADLTVDISLEAYTRGAHADALAGTVRYSSDADSATATPFAAVCPAPGRAWFVWPAHRLPGWLTMLVMALLLAGAGTGIAAAWQTFAGEYDRSLIMNLGAVLALAAFMTLMFAEIAPPGLGRFGIPRWRVRVALDTSDSVRFPVVPNAQTPVPGPAGQNDVCRFIAQCVNGIATTVDDAGAPARRGFRAWLRHAWRDIGTARVRAGLLRASEGVRIYHSLPLAEIGMAGTAPAHTPALAQTAALTDLPALLTAGYRGQAPGFFLPWAGMDVGVDKELIVAFMTGEPASPQQADRLVDAVDGLKAAKPAGIRVLSVLLPALPRARHTGWDAAARRRNAAAVSDLVVDVQSRAPAAPDAAPISGVAMETIPVFPALPAGPDADTGVAPDLDAVRSKLLRADPAQMRAASKRIAGHVRGLSDVRESSAFQTAPLTATAGLVAVAGLLLFLRLQREIRVLDLRRPTGNLEWLGALCGLGAGLMAALVICYVTSEPMRWCTRAGVGMTGWGVVLLWYAGVWLPMLIGRGLGALPAPGKMLRVRHLAVWFAAAMVATGLVAGLGLYWPTGAGRLAPASIAGAGMAVTAAIFVSMALRYQWVCFWRQSRRRIWLLGVAGLLALIALPVWHIAVPALGAYVPWIWGGVSITAVLLPGVGAVSAGRRWGRRGARIIPGLGWTGLIYGLASGILVALLLRWPQSVL